MRVPAVADSRSRSLKAATASQVLWATLSELRFRLVLLLGSVAYVAIVLWSYVYIVAPDFAYSGYTYSQPAPVLFLLSCTVAVVPSLWMPITLRRPSQVIYWLLYLLVFVPASTIPFLSLYIDSGRLLLFEASLFVAFASLSIVHKIPLLRLPRLRTSALSFWMVVALLSVSFYVYIVSVFGLRFNIVALTAAYDLRSEYKATLGTEGSLVQYALRWQSYTLNPLLIAYGLTNKRPILLLGGVSGQLMIFSITGF